MWFFAENRLIDGDLRRDALSLQKSGDWDDQGPQAADAIGAESGGTSAMNRWGPFRFYQHEKDKVSKLVLSIVVRSIVCLIVAWLLWK